MRKLKFGEVRNLLETACSQAGISSHSCTRSDPEASVWPKALSFPPAPPGGQRAVLSRELAEHSGSQKPGICWMAGMG